MQNTFTFFSKKPGKIFFTLDFFMIVFVLMVYLVLFLPQGVKADVEEQEKIDQILVSEMIKTMQNQTLPYGSLPTAKQIIAKKSYIVPITAYTSDIAQTDSTPCITASGLDVCKKNEETVIAANFLPMGTKVRIPELFGERIFTVEDRMNRRYNKRVDIWMREYQDAKQFGVKHAKVEVF